MTLLPSGPAVQGWSRRTHVRVGVAITALALAASGVAVAAAPPAQAATAITINGSSGGRVVRRRRRDQRRRRQLPAARRLSRAAAQPDPRLPVQARVRRRHADPQGRDRRRHQLDLRRRAEPRAHPRRASTATAATSGGWPSRPRPATRTSSCTRLAWGAPGWIGNGNFWSTDMIDYLVAWLDCAKHARADDRLPRRLEREGLQHHLVREPALGPQLARLRQRQDRGLRRLRLGRRRRRAARPRVRRRRVDVFGSHYVCGYRSAQTSCPSSGNAMATGKPLWASENGSDDYNAGANALARGINRGYIDGKMTAYINWPVIAAITPEHPLADHGRRRGLAAVVGQLLDRQERLGDGADHAVHRARLAVPRRAPAATSAATGPTAATSR